MTTDTDFGPCGVKQLQQTHTKPYCCPGTQHLSTCLLTICGPQAQLLSLDKCQAVGEAASGEAAQVLNLWH